MRLKSSIIAIIALNSMSFAGGDIGGVVDLGNKYEDFVPAKEEYVAPVQEYVAPVQEYVAPAEEYVAPAEEYVAPAEEYVAPAPAPAPYVPAPTPVPYVAPAPTPYIAPPVTPTVPPVVVTPTPTPTPTPKPTPVYNKPKASGPSGLYVGGAITGMAARSDCEGNRANLFSEEKGQDRQIGFTGILGYDFMEYLGAELRTSMGLAEDDYGTKMEQYGLYLKPNIDLGKALNLYGLLGYSTTNMSDCGSRADLDSTNSGFSYGAGLDYGVTENISVFTDIVNYLRDDETRSTWGTSVGVKYKF